MTIREAKKSIGKLCSVEWADAKGEMGAHLETLKNKGFACNKTYGIVVFIGKIPIKGYDIKLNGLIIKTEESSEDSQDYTMIPLGWVLKIVKMKKK